MSLIVAYEGDTDLPVIRKLASNARLAIANEIDCGGKGALDREFNSYNNAATGSPWLVVRDLNSDAPCAPAFINDKGFQAKRWMCFRLAVHELESWLMADVGGFSEFFSVDRALLPSQPDQESDPTATLIALVRKSSNGRIRRAMVPPAGAHTDVGPLYEAKIIEFGAGLWSLDRACSRSPSLRRAKKALKSLAKKWKAHISGRGR